ncbi:MAG: flagellar motor protein MotB [Eubacteriales bacterium]
MKRRRKTIDEEERGYSWMDTYGDMVTLLLCFFVLIYSFSSLDAEKFHMLVRAFSGKNMSYNEIPMLNEIQAREDPIGIIDPMVNYNNRIEEDEIETEDSAGGAGDVGGDNNVDEEGEEDVAFDGLYESIKKYINDFDLGNQVSVVRIDRKILLRFNELALFNSGKADILPESVDTIKNIARIIGWNIECVKMVCIEGHTDIVPMTSKEFLDNWDLSTRRATNTLRLILDTGYIEPDKLSAMGYGEYRPIDTNDTPEGRANNRRVDIIIEKNDT